MESKLREEVKKLFADGKVDLVIGYETGTLPGRSRPCFVESADDADRLVWNSHCTNNLAVYLPSLFEIPLRSKEKFIPPRAGIVAKGCDIRSVFGLIKEKQVPRDNIVIIGMPCEGMVGADGESLRACEECAFTGADGADIRIDGKAKDASDCTYADISEFESKSPEERWAYFTGEISKCIRCYACRQACPNCYCKVCFADQTKPRWIGPTDDLSEVMAYHIGRIFHQAGRCVECDACVRACPMGIDLRVFTRKVGKDVNELFGYVPGKSAEDLPPLCTFTEADSEEFITEP